MIELKTTTALGVRRPRYSMQQRLYVRAASVATGEPTTRSILWLQEYRTRRLLWAIVEVHSVPA